jgi:hypothetical protein
VAKLCFFIPDEMDAKLKLACKELEVSKSAQIRILIKKFLKEGRKNK